MSEVKFSESLLTLDIGYLRLGTKVIFLRKVGINTINDVLEFLESNDLFAIDGIGRKTASLASSNLKTLCNSIRPDGNVDWDEYSEKLNLIIIGGSSQEDNFKLFLNSLDTMWEKIIPAFEDPLDKSIIKLRLSKQGNDRSTLEGLAKIAVPPVTRERVRQKENKILRCLVLALIFDEYGSEKFLFDPDFGTLWKNLANATPLNQIEIGEFVKLASKTWDIPEKVLVPKLPTILQLVTGEVYNSSANAFNQYFDPKLLYGLKEATREIKAVSVIDRTNFRAVKRLIDLETLGEFIDYLRTNYSNKAPDYRTKKTLLALSKLSHSIDKDGAFDWTSYAETLGKKLILSRKLSLKSFIEKLPEDTVTIINSVTFRKNGKKILKERSIIERKNRKTTTMLSEELATVPPVITILERHSIRRLQSILFGRDFHHSEVIISPNYLDHWKQLSMTYYESGKDFEKFENMLFDNFGINPSLIKEGKNILVPFLTGYSYKRASRYTSNRSTEIKKDIQEFDFSSKIILRGFRRVH